MPDVRPAGARIGESRSRTKVLFVIGTLDVGGSETQLIELASRLDRRLFETVVCTQTTGGSLEAPLRARGVRVLTLGLTRREPGRQRLLQSAIRVPLATLRLRRIMVRERPDIVHGVLFTAYVQGAFVARLARVGVVVASRRSLGLFKERRPFYLWLERIADRITDIFIANSEAVRVDTLAREPIDPARIIVIHNGVDFEQIDAARGLGAAPPPPVGSPRVLVVSNFIHYKGHEFFLRAWADVLRRFPEGVALLAGDGPLRDRLETLSGALGIRHAVQFLGVRRDVPSLLAQADLFVHPSLEEGYSNAVLEAMAAGLPVVACAVGGNVEAIADGVTGLLVPPSDSAALAKAMDRLLADPPAARQMGARARAFVHARHDMDSMVRQYEAVYRRLLAGHEPETAAVPAGAVQQVTGESTRPRCAE